MKKKLGKHLVSMNIISNKNIVQKCYIYGHLIYIQSFIGLNYSIQE